MKSLQSLSRRTFTLGAGAAGLGIFVAPAEARTIWPDGARAAVSLTYDDGCESQLDHVAPALNKLGLKATFFLTIENMNARRADWVALSQQGHEIGDHTMSHPCMLKEFSAERFMQEQIIPAEHYLDVNFGGPKPRSYAYPCGFEGLGPGATVGRVQRYLEDLRPTFLAARTVDGPPNDPREALRQRYFLNGFEPTYDVDDVHFARRYVQKAIDKGHWAILVFHEVLPARRGEGDTSIAVHRSILQYLARENVWCAPMRTVFSYVTGTV